MARGTDGGSGLISTYQADTGQMHENVSVNLVVLYSLAVSTFELNIIFISSLCSSFPVQSIPTNKDSVRNVLCFTLSSRLV